jgi:hypothetical protein
VHLELLLIAATATFALNDAEWLRRDRFISSAPRRQRRPLGHSFTLIRLSDFPEPLLTPQEPRICCSNSASFLPHPQFFLESIDHTRTKTKSPQTNGICERFHQTIQNEFYASAFRRKLYHSLQELQGNVDAWIESYNAERTHIGKYCYGKTPLDTFIESATLAYDKQLDRIKPKSEPASAKV